MFLGGLSLLMVVEYFASSLSLSDQIHDDAVLDLALKQNFEMQRVGFLVGLLGENHRMKDHNRHREELAETVKSLENNYRIMLEGDTHIRGHKENFRAIYYLPPVSFDSNFRSFIVDAKSIINDETEYTQLDDPRVQRMFNALDGPLGIASKVLVEAIQKQNDEHSERFGWIVKLSLLVTLLVLILSFPLIFMPLARRTAHEMDKQVSTTNRLRTVLNGTVDAIVTITDQGKIRTFNLAAYSIFGYSRKEVIGKNVKMLMPESIAINHDQYLSNYLDTGEGVAIGQEREVEGLRKDGSVFPLKLKITESFSDGEVFFIGIIHDLSEQKRHEKQIAEYQMSLEKKIEQRTRKLSLEVEERRNAEASLNESRRRLEAISKSLFEGVLVIDHEGKVQFSNPSAEKLLGVAAKTSIEGRFINDLFQLETEGGPVDFEETPFFSIARDGGLFRDDEARFVTAGGTVLDVAYACSSFRDEDNINGGILSFRDTQDLKRAQQESLQASKLASVGHLAAGIAHEINTPTQYIGDNLRFLKESIEDLFGILESCRNLIRDARKTENFAEQAGKIETAMEEIDLDYLVEEIPEAASQSLSGVEQVSRIVLAMKDFSHPGSREKTYNDLNKAIESTLTVCRNEWKHVAELETDLDPSLVPVKCLGGEINQVFLNLIINAAHAIKDAKGDAMGKIYISTRLEGDWVEIRIADDGSGIPDDVKERIFDPFFTTKEVGKGTGQGLSVCRDIVTEKHDGKITFESKTGEGTMFIIRLPVDSVTDQDDNEMLS